ncbi:MAG: hypothetical protein KF857_01915 [Fimbriimonadaceae bacterium]|nr:hypothetical protein [Fimbriimonadaceae bacterium]
MDWIRTGAVATAAFAAGTYVTLLQAEQSPALDIAGLKTMVQGLGYETKDINKEPGKEKFEFVTKSANFNVPIGVEISPSKNYVWLTVFLGANSPTKKHEALLKENANIQPSFFYITSSGNLMMAEAMDNRGITAPIMKRCVEKLIKDVDRTSTSWKD